MKLGSVLLVLVATIALGVLLPRGAIADDDDSRSVYLALGDSVPLGGGASDPDETGYVALFHDFLAELNDEDKGKKKKRRKKGKKKGQRGDDDDDDGDGDGIRLVNLAIEGEMSGSFIADGQLRKALRVINRRRTDVEVVSLHVGGNDLLAPLQPGAPCDIDPGSLECALAFAAALSGYAQNYGIILGALTDALSRDPGREVLMVQTVYNPFPFDPLLTIGDLSLLGQDLTIDCVANASNPALVGLNDLITCIGGLFGTTVVDVYPAFVGNALIWTHILVGDGNPNDLGHAAIADEFIAAFPTRGDDDDDNSSDDDSSDDDSSDDDSSDDDRSGGDDGGSDDNDD